MKMIDWRQIKRFFTQFILMDETALVIESADEVQSSVRQVETCMQGKEVVTECG